MNRRAFLQKAAVVLAAPAIAGLNRRCGFLWYHLEHTTMGNIKTLEATAYYRKVLTARKDYVSSDPVNGWSNECMVNFEGGSTAAFRVNANQHHLVGIEGSGKLNLSEITGVANTWIPLSISSKNRWFCHPDSPWGRGNRSNPLVSGRDFANNHWPFGTRLLWAPNHSAFRCAMFCGDVFGGDQPPNRIDLFAGDEIDFGKPTIVGDVEYPWTDNGAISTKSVKGGQQCLNRLGFIGANGKPLAEDNRIGPQTEFALKCFWGIHYKKFSPGCNILLHDPEVFWTLRMLAKVHEGPILQ